MDTDESGFTRQATVTHSSICVHLCASVVTFLLSWRELLDQRFPELSQRRPQTGLECVRLHCVCRVWPMDYRLANGQRRRAPEEALAVDWAPALQQIPGLPCEPVLRPSDLTPPWQGMQEYGFLLVVGDQDPALTFWGRRRTYHSNGKGTQGDAH